MARLLPRTSVEVGDLDILAPAVSGLFVYIWYLDGEPDSPVTYFWKDEGTGIIHHELLFNVPVPYDEAMKCGYEHACASSIERIHVRHATSKARGVAQRKEVAEDFKGPQSLGREASRSQRENCQGPRAEPVVEG